VAKKASPEETLAREFMQIPAWLGRMKADPEAAAHFAAETLRPDELEVQITAGRPAVAQMDTYVSILEGELKARRERRGLV